MESTPTAMVPTVSRSKLRIALAYVGIFIVSAGDTVRYSIGFPAWGALCFILAAVCLTQFLRNNPRQTLSRMPATLTALLGYMILSVTWSAYPLATLLGFSGTAIATIFALFLVSSFSWRQLMNQFARVFWVILAASFAFEIYAAVVVRGPIAPIFKNYTGPVPPSGAYYWTQGTLLHGTRIQGIVGNANLLAYIAMLGVILFAIRMSIRAGRLFVNVTGVLMSLAAFALTRSAGIGFATAMVILVALVALIAEGHDRETRHRYYRLAWTGIGIMVFFILVYRSQLFTLIGKSPDMTGRLDIWKAVSGLIAQRWFQGWGWISYWMPGVKPYDGLIVRDNVTYYQAHDSYLDMWLQLGVIGFLLFMAMLAVTFVKLWRLGVRHTSALYLWPLLIFVALLGQNLTESRMIIELGWVLVVLFATKVNEPAENLEPRGQAPKRLRLRLFGKWLNSVSESGVVDASHQNR
ncbi:MAG: O-antigen ligase family protein [Micrococcales bacterium]